MGNIIKVGMADLNVCKAPDGLTTLGLGSCIGLTLYDPVTKIGGMVHYMLPDSTKVSNNSNKAKFADTGIDELLKKVIAAGASKTRLVAKIAGGAKMFEVSGLSDVGNIGARNAEAAKKILKEKGIRMAVATSSSPELYEPALKRNGIYEYFKAFVTVSEVKRGKGFPDIYEKAAEKLSLPPETCVVYEDILAGIRGAKMGGFAAVGVYDRSGEGNRAKMEQEADRYVTSFKELMNGGDSFFYKF